MSGNDSESLGIDSKLSGNNSDDCIANESNETVTVDGDEMPTKIDKEAITIMKEWIPECDEELKPKEGMEFQTLAQCEEFYKSYAHHVGFSMRKSIARKDKIGDVKYRYLLCSKEGFKEDTNNSKGKAKQHSKKQRNRKLTREWCNALVGFRRTDDGKYVVYKFHEAHTHLLATPSKKHMLRSNRAITSVHRTLFKSLSVSNVGASKSHRIIKEQVGGFQNVGCSQQDLKNFQRDLKTFIKDSDAQMFIDNLRRKNEVNSSFYFAYEVDEDGRLENVFWCDSLSRRNYAIYGDVVSFDTTYDTNRYKMIFAPFTGIDNHRGCITFGAALLVSEKRESFVWLFEKFLEAMGDHKPICLITDQDPAMKVAIPLVFDTSYHRFCLWHIMRKLSEKVGVALWSDVGFNSKFKACVYNSETAEEFESVWNAIITEYHLKNNDWLGQLYENRRTWIPAYFKDMCLGRVMKTTSRSESENNFFCNFTNPHLSLVEFWMRYEGAVEIQRHRQSLLDHQSLSSVPQLKTNRGLERHAGTIYTCTNFDIFQKQLWSACMDYEVYDRRETEEGDLVITVTNSCQGDFKRRTVRYNPLTHVAQCSCKMFEGEGIPCRHILCLLKGLDELPRFYVVERWTKLASRKPIYDLEGNVMEGCSQLGCEEQQIQKNWMNFLSCMQLAGRDLTRQAIVSKAIKDAMQELEDPNEHHGNTSENKIRELESFIGSSAPSVVDILPPNEVHTKGSGKRIKGGKELAMELQQKRKRLCRTCGEGNHNSRTCSKK